MYKDGFKGHPSFMYPFIYELDPAATTATLHFICQQYNQYEIWEQFGYSRCQKSVSTWHHALLPNKSEKIYYNTLYLNLAVYKDWLCVFSVF